ncbi:hypothetical protein V6Z11_D12G070200 [Gossypium hirsutum]|uniref:Uncharacterized protein n=1 Tax=Gossypium tomentosum TaxID=34277 RepID=A0A5D2I5V3_GOSTO|nr:hypothetical protein ES332_D12G072700v1 [Gossypium tomentosum]
MDAEPNDRKIGKLCEYASRNPLRIPKITSNLEQRCFKDLRNENFGCVKAVLCIYRKLLSSSTFHFGVCSLEQGSFKERATDFNNYMLGHFLQVVY